MPQQETLLAELDPQPRTVSSRRNAESEITQIVSAASGATTLTSKAIELFGLIVLTSVIERVNAVPS